MFKFLLNNYKNIVYLNSSRVRLNIWSFVHVHILYTYQRTSIMVWLNTINGLSSKFIKTIKYNFDFINLYKNSISYFIFIISIMLVI